MRYFRRFLTALLVTLLAACGGGGGGGGSSGAGGGGVTASTPDCGNTHINAAGPIVTAQQASRFLAQASFGANQAYLDNIVASNVETWIERQFACPRASHLDHVNTIKAGLASGDGLYDAHFLESFWKQAISGNDQLRQRISFALSQIFVVSMDGTLEGEIRSVASFYDMLAKNAFGNFRTLLEDVSLHPAMGRYLSHLANRKEDVASGRMPDENYAREVMQLFTIGLYQLNTDGTLKLDGNGKPIETYTNADVTGLAKVFTGWSWAGPDKSDTRFFWGNPDPNRDVMPMQGYPQWHSKSAKSFLGTTITAQSTADPTASLKMALDVLFNHPNVGPFIGRQLIQRLVTSNPSPAYVGRVAAAFNNNGSGVRGDMKAVIRAVLLDTEARSVATAQGVGYGKLREPVLRLANWARAFGAAPASGRYAIGNTDNPGSSLGQSAMRSSSVFNFYRPGYVPPNTQIAANGLVAPEMQITHETSVAGYINYLQSILPQGPGPYTGKSEDRVGTTYTAFLGLADNATSLVDYMNLVFMAGNMKAATRSQIISAVNGISVPVLNGDAARRNRIYLAIMLSMAGPEYLVQK